MTNPRLRIAFLAGPANAREIYREWAERADQVYFGTDYMKQFIQLSHDLRADSHVVTWHGQERRIEKFGSILFDNRPITNAGGARYYLDHVLWHLRVLVAFIKFRPDVLLLTGNQNFWWVLSPIRLLGPAIIPSYHAVLWPKFRPVVTSWRILLWLNRRLMFSGVKGIVLTSRDIRRQVEKLLGRKSSRVAIFEHLPTYSPEQFAPIAPPEHGRVPFRVFFMSRIEENKGVYDIVRIAERLNAEERGSFVFDVCGSGAALSHLKKMVISSGLESVVRCHGFVSPDTVQNLLSQSHVCIVPTRKDYEAGFEMTCAEAILAGRPLVTSSVCPALEYLCKASVEVAPEDIPEYVTAIKRLRDDCDFYQSKQRACRMLQGQFYDRANSWYVAVMRALQHQLGTGRVMMEDVAAQKAE